MSNTQHLYEALACAQYNQWTWWVTPYLMCASFSGHNDVRSWRETKKRALPLPASGQSRTNGAATMILLFSSRWKQMLHVLFQPEQLDLFHTGGGKGREGEGRGGERLKMSPRRTKIVRFNPNCYPSSHPSSFTSLSRLILSPSSFVPPTILCSLSLPCSLGVRIQRRFAERKAAEGDWRTYNDRTLRRDRQTDRHRLLRDQKYRISRGCWLFNELTKARAQQSRHPFTQWCALMDIMTNRWKCFKMAITTDFITAMAGCVCVLMCRS